MPRSADLRAGRFSETGRIYLLTATVQGRRPLFSGFAPGRLVVAELRRAHDEGLVKSLTWVVMPDHLHWLVELRNCTANQLMRQVKGRSARRVNALLGTTGALWQDGYHDRAIRREQDLLTVARYVVANPLRAGLVSKLGDYPLWDAVWLESDRG
ncbi:REP-associated tyrosine transposase [Pseudomonas sp. TE3786]